MEHKLLWMIATTLLLVHFREREMTNYKKTNRLIVEGAEIRSVSAISEYFLVYSKIKLIIFCTVIFFFIWALYFLSSGHPYDRSTPDYN
jgi:hypothetical protein